MSQDNAVRFIQIVYADEALRTQVVALGQDTNGLLKLAASRGFEFSIDEFTAAVRTAGYDGNEELSEAELSSVTGGSGGAWTSTCNYGEVGGGQVVCGINT